MPGRPAGPDRHAEHAARADHRLDTTKRGFFNADYNHAFNAAGSHTIRAASASSTSSTTSNQAYPGGYVDIYWDRTFSHRPARDRAAAPTATTRSTTSATRGKAGANILSLYVQDQWTVGNRLTLNLGLRTENEKVPSFRPDMQTTRSSSASATSSRRASARPTTSAATAAEAVRQLGPLLRLDQVRAAARLVRRRHLAHLLPLARHARHRQPEPEQHAGPRPLGAAPRRLPRPPRADFDTTDPNIKPMSQDSTNVGIEYPARRRRRCSARTTCTTTCSRTIEDIGALVERQRDLRHRQPRRRHAPRSTPPSGADARRSRRRSRSASTTRSNSTLSRRFSQQLVLRARTTR